MVMKKFYPQNVSTNHIYLIYIYIYIYEEDLALNNLYRLICHKTQTKSYIFNIYVLRRFGIK